MPLVKTQAEGINLADTFAFSGTVSGANSPYWVGQKASEQTLSRNTKTAITGMTTNEKDSHSAFDGTTFTVPSGGAGIYFIFGVIHFDWSAVGNDGESQIVYLTHTPSGGSATDIAYSLLNVGSNSNIDTFVRATVTFQLGVGDTVTLNAYAGDYNGGGGGKAKETSTNFGGFRITGV